MEVKGQGVSKQEEERVEGGGAGEPVYELHLEFICQSNIDPALPSVKIEPGPPVCPAGGPTCDRCEGVHLSSLLGLLRFSALLLSDWLWKKGQETVILLSRCVQVSKHQLCSNTRTKNTNTTDTVHY